MGAINETILLLVQAQVMNFLAYIILWGTSGSLQAPSPFPLPSSPHLILCTLETQRNIITIFKPLGMLSFYFLKWHVKKHVWNKTWAKGTQLTRARLDEQCQWLSTCFIHAVLPMGPPHMQSAQLTWYRCLPMMGFCLTMLTCHLVEVRPQIQIEPNYYMNHVGRCWHRIAGFLWPM